MTHFSSCIFSEEQLSHQAYGRSQEYCHKYYSYHWNSSSNHAYQYGCEVPDHTDNHLWKLRKLAAHLFGNNLWKRVIWRNAHVTIDIHSCTDDETKQCYNEYRPSRNAIAEYICGNRLAPYPVEKIYLVAHKNHIEKRAKSQAGPVPQDNDYQQYSIYYELPRAK